MFKGKKDNKILCKVMTFLTLTAISFALFISPVKASDRVTARPSVNGALHVDGRDLVDKNGEKVQLRGVSTHGLTWYPDFIDEDLFKGISADWNCDLIRLAMYSESYCGPDKEESLETMIKGIEAAMAADMYVIVDWHILNDHDPNINKDEAISFFDTISARYEDSEYIIYEICNEPNGDTGWSEITDYADEVIPVIRKHSPHAVILVGTPQYDRELSAAALRPLGYDNVMYVLHFYTASHHEGLRKELEAAHDSGLPVFISECGICEASGDGTIDFRSAADWFSFLDERDISYAVWSLSNKDESSAFFKNGVIPKGIPKDSDLTVSGKWIRQLIRGDDPLSIPYPAQTVEKTIFDRILSFISDSLVPRGFSTVRKWIFFALGSVTFLALVIFAGSAYAKKHHFSHTYDDLYDQEISDPVKKRHLLFSRVLLVISSFLTIIYLGWRMTYSVPADAGIVSVMFNLILLGVEMLGFIESLILYQDLMGKKEHPLPQITDEEFPEVDIFVATYNEPVELLRKTINGCVRLKYPDKSKVHVWICDDNRRKEMAKLAKEMGVGYFDRPDNQGAKAGNLNCAMARTTAPYIVTFDADMIPRSDFLLRTIPYFVDSEKRNAALPEEEQLHLGLLQTPQAFYDPDVFQHALYSEKRVPNEQDFFYRTIEPAKTSSNSVIYGGSNTMIARRALDDIGGFYTGSITEDFATGLLIEAKGYVSLAISEPLASGQTPDAYKDHITQRTRWGRGVIATARQLHIFKRKDLDLRQKISYWSSVIYWYSPIKNLIYILSPLLYAALAIPVFKCNWLELIVFWLPMYVLQDLCLRYVSSGSISLKWSGIYETSVMPHLLIPIIKESLGITLSAFKVTDKSARKEKKKADMKILWPFLVLITLSVFGIVRILIIFRLQHLISAIVILFWLIRNLYFLVMAVFLVDGRETDGENVRVIDTESIIVRVDHGKDKGRIYEGITTLLCEHRLSVFLDESEDLKTGTLVNVVIEKDDVRADLSGVITEVMGSRNRMAVLHTIEILDYGKSELDYLAILYDRIPTLPQRLNRDFGVLRHLWRNIAGRAARSFK